MKIISKFKDYYDSSSSFYDDSIILKRKTENIKKPDQKLNIPILPIKFRSSSMKINGEKFEAKPQIFPLYFCGKIYPIYNIILLKKNEESSFGEVKEELYFSSLEEMDYFIEENLLKLDMVFNFKDFMRKKRTQSKNNDLIIISKKIEEMINYDPNKKLFHDLRVPYFILNEDGLTTYPQLKKYIKSFKMDSFTAYQEIEMFVSGVLGEIGKEIIVISDKDKRDSKGFDDKSFKKRKN